jgi:hypothetical protein
MNPDTELTLVEDGGVNLLIDNQGAFEWATRQENLHNPNQLKLIVSEQVTASLAENHQNSIEGCNRKNLGQRSQLGQFAAYLTGLLPPVPKLFDEICRKDDALPCKVCLGEKYTKVIGQTGVASILGCENCNSTGERPMTPKGQLFKKMIQQKLWQYLVDPLVMFCGSDWSETQANFLGSGCDLVGEVSHKDEYKFASGLGHQEIEKNSPNFNLQGY